MSSKPLVSILIPAYNSERWIEQTLQSAVNQTWPNREIIVVDDGSTDRTAEIARRFASRGVVVITQDNRGAPAARNHAYNLSHGEYIQYLDADDLLAPDKIERQLEAPGGADDKRTLFAASVGRFYFRPERTRFAPMPAQLDFTPLDWFLTSLTASSLTWLQTASCLISREIADATGPWDERFLCYQDCEYSTRLVMASRRLRFVPESKVYHRVTPSGTVGDFSGSPEKVQWVLRDILQRVEAVGSLENSARARKACLFHLQSLYGVFYFEWPEYAAEMQFAARQLGGHLDPPPLRWKYAWMKPIFGGKFANRAQTGLPRCRHLCFWWHWDKFMYKLERKKKMAIA